MAALMGRFGMQERAAQMLSMGVQGLMNQQVKRGRHD
jgi:hypothetical protein